MRRRIRSYFTTGWNAFAVVLYLQKVWPSVRCTELCTPEFGLSLWPIGFLHSKQIGPIIKFVTFLNIQKFLLFAIFKSFQVLVCVAIVIVCGIVGTSNFDQMFAFGIDRWQPNRPGRWAGRWRRVLTSPCVTRTLASTQAGHLILVPCVGLLRVGLGVPQLVELPRFLDERSAVFFSLLPQWRGCAKISRTVWECSDLRRERLREKGVRNGLVRILEQNLPNSFQK